jgi:hypothetical protein
MTRKQIHCPKCNEEVSPVRKRDFDKLLKATIGTSPLTLKELKAKLKKEREEKSAKKEENHATK